MVGQVNLLGALALFGQLLLDDEDLEARQVGVGDLAAVTLALAVFKGFEWRKVLPFSLAQTAGAFVAALIVRWNYGEAIAAIDPDHTIDTQGIFSTLPGNGALDISQSTAFFDQIIGTAKQAIAAGQALAQTELRIFTGGQQRPEIFAAHARHHQVGSAGGVVDTVVEQGGVEGVRARTAGHGVVAAIADRKRAVVNLYAAVLDKHDGRW